jgi:hypothetical protein
LSSRIPRGSVANAASHLCVGKTSLTPERRQSWISAVTLMRVCAFRQTLKAIITWIKTSNAAHPFYSSISLCDPGAGEVLARRRQ